MNAETMRRADGNFILQQGLPLPEADPRALMAALMFQPRAVGVWFAAGWLL